ncbi:T9SS type A sorting domain-containing protein [Flavobacterium sp.]|uniref:T9SS type A sorting domain-containing protein n=1 Tax=Flavobacterium sp. TaxID=239 RepID=UPI001B62591B|nr:T9SS type A sorting domain-containing protein [Flavobacterium sp.]MBP6128210.1 T9SS type A sorting domain-containing protein [Flavobacterium sp.]
MKLKLLFITLLACFTGWGQVNLPFSYDLGNPSSVNGLTSSGLASDYASSPKMKFDGSSDNLILNFNGSPNVLTFTIKWNQSTSATRFPGDFQVLESSDGVNYTNIQLYNSTTGTALTNGSSIIQIFSGLNSTTRYIKWIYVAKTNGNIALGGISLTAIPTSTTYTTSWSNSAPTATIDATIAGDLSTTTDLTCKDLTINSGKTLTIGAGKKLSVTGNLINNGTLVFKSDATGTAVFDVFSGSLSPAGSTIVERYIPARRAYRFLSPSVTTSTSIRANWQENGVTTAGLGTHITGATGASAGFDPTETNNSSLLYFNSGAWVAASNTSVNAISAGDAYCLMVRGDRTIDLSTNTPTPTNTVLRTTGTLFTGNFSPTLSTVASGYSFVGNPYQAPLDIKTALATSSSNINPNVVYYWDPTLNARGGYITRNLQTSVNNPTSNVNDYVQAGQAFFVVNKITLTGTPALTFTESHKSVANAAAGAFRNANSNEYGTLRVNLKANTNNQWQTIEGAVAIFNSNFSTAVTEEDATKMTNLDEEVSFVQNNTSLAIACQPNPALTSELPIRLNKTRHTNYQWQFDIANYSGPTPFLVDTQNNSITQITNTTVVPFTADTNANRFKIVFQNAALNLSDFSTQLALYPNPAKAGDSFYIDGISEASVTVFNVLGQNIQAQTKSQGNSVQVTPNTSLSKGVYLVTITTQGNTQQVKWIVE